MEYHNLIKLDGSYAEGGGQIIRTALALSALTGKPFEVNNIRKGRKVPGLKAQHLHCIKALQELCNARTDGAQLGSESLQFFPGVIKPKTISIDIGTAGSITLLLQSLLLPCIIASGKTRLKIIGGTDVAWSLPVDYLVEIILPQLRKYADIELKLEQRGYYPQGAGKIDLKIVPKFSKDKITHAKTMRLTDQGTLLQIKGVSHCSKDLADAQAADRQANAAKTTLKDIGCPVQLRTEYCNTLSTGSGITLWAVFSKEEDTDQDNPIRLGADILGERGKTSEEVGAQAAEALIKEIQSNAPVDKHLCDNLIPFLAVFGGVIKTSEITPHTKSNIYAVEQFFGKVFEVKEETNTIIVKTPVVLG